MKTILKIAITLCLSGFALTSHAQSFDMLDIVKMMDRPVKHKASGKMAKAEKNSQPGVGVASAIPADQTYNSPPADAGDATQAEVAVADRLLDGLPVTTADKALPSNRQGGARFYHKRKAPARTGPRLLLISPANPGD